MAFVHKYCSLGHHTGFNESHIITNSETVKVGDIVRITSGFAIRAAITTSVRGVVTDIVDQNGTSLHAASTDDYDGTWTPSTNTYAAAADNQTDKKVKVLVQSCRNCVYSSTPDATIGTTTGSNLFGYFTDVIAATAVPDESGTSTSSGQMFIHGLDPDDSTKGLYSIAEHQGSGTDATA